VQEQSIERKDSPGVNTSHGIEVAMVTTRRGTETPGQEATPRSSVSKRVTKRELELQDTPANAKRQRKTTPRKTGEKVGSEPGANEDEPAQRSVEELSDTIAVLVPSTETTNSEGLLPIRRRSSPRVVVAKPSPPISTETEAGDEADTEDASVPTQEIVYETADQGTSSVSATPGTHKFADGSSTPRATKASQRTQTPVNESNGGIRGLHLEVEQITVEVTPTPSQVPDSIPSSTYESEQAPITSQDAPLSSSPPKTAHVRFGSEEPVELSKEVSMNSQGHKRYEVPMSTQEQAIEELLEEDDNASDSDEAPEVITTTAAASKAKASEAEASRALLAQQEKARHQREAREKRIAEEQAEKRKREEIKAKKVARKAARQRKAQPDLDTEVPAPRLEIDASNIPALLPDSLLATLPDHRAPTPPPQRAGKTEEELRREKLNHHIKFLERGDKSIKDVKKGRLSVTVLGQHNKVLPPKINKHSRHVRESWLKGREGEKKKGGKPNIRFGKLERRAYGNHGFLRGED
jgi:U3 small nucleolar RNA-associated protein 16